MNQATVANLPEMLRIFLLNEEAKGSFCPLLSSQRHDAAVNSAWPTPYPRAPASTALRPSGTQHQGDEFLVPLVAKS